MENTSRPLMLCRSLTSQLAPVATKSALIKKLLAKSTAFDGEHVAGMQIPLRRPMFSDLTYTPLEKMIGFKKNSKKYIFEIKIF